MHKKVSLYKRETLHYDTSLFIKMKIHKIEIQS